MEFTKLWIDEMALVGDITKRQRDAQSAGIVPEYPDFVRALFKPMGSDTENMLHACVGMAGEAGEVLDAAKKCWTYGKKLDVMAHIKELGDLRFYYQAELNRLGITDEQVIACNKDKLLQRYEGLVYSDSAAIAQGDKVPEAVVRTKPTVKIENWMVVRNCLMGDTIDHPNGPGGRQFARTSAVVKMNVEEGTCETENTIYLLGIRANE